MEAKKVVTHDKGEVSSDSGFEVCLLCYGKGFVNGYPYPCSGCAGTGQGHRSVYPSQVGFQIKDYMAWLRRKEARRDPR